MKISINDWVEVRYFWDIETYDPDFNIFDCRFSNGDKFFIPATVFRVNPTYFYEEPEMIMKRDYRFNIDYHVIENNTPYRIVLDGDFQINGVYYLHEVDDENRQSISASKTRIANHYLAEKQAGDWLVSKRYKGSKLNGPIKFLHLHPIEKTTDSKQIMKIGHFTKSESALLVTHELWVTFLGPNHSYIRLQANYVRQKYSNK